MVLVQLIHDSLHLQKSLGASDLAIIHEVIIPGALPNIITGLSIGMGTCWFCLVTAEMISGATWNWILHMGIFHLAKL